jgi:uncharacterized protein
MHGQFVWYELTTPDVEAARRFYPTFTGWGTKQFDKDYMMWTTGGRPFAGIFRLGPDMRQQGVPPNWMPYIEASNVDDTARLAGSLGGSVLHGPEDIPGTGRFAVIKDPQGATFGIYKSTGPSQSWDGTPKLGAFVWHELMTTDYTKAFEFYRRLFGWEKTSQMDMGGGNMYVMYGKAGVSYGGIYNRTSEMAGVPPFWLVYVGVRDAKQAIESATRGGAKLERGPMPVPGGQIAILSDPQGAAFAMFEAEPRMVAGTPSSTAKKAATRPAAKKSAARKSTAKKSTAKKTTAKKSAAKKSARKNAGAKRSAAKRSGTKRSAAKRSAAKKSRRASPAKSKRRR